MAVTTTWPVLTPRAYPLPPLHPRRLRAVASGQSGAEVKIGGILAAGKVSARMIIYIFNLREPGALPCLVLLWGLHTPSGLLCAVR